MPNENAHEVLRGEAALRAAFLTTPLDEGALRDAVCAYVDDAKHAGWPVERVIVALKRHSEIEDGPLYRLTRDPLQRHVAADVMRRLIKWCIDHYFWSEA